MGVALAVFIVYSVVITIVLIVTISDKNRYLRYYKSLEKELKELKELKAVSTPKTVPQPEALPQTPASQAVQPPAPQASIPAPQVAPAREKKSGPSAVGVSFSVGVLLMVIAAAVFISATWQTLPAIAKCVVLLLVVSVVYGLSAFTGKKLKLKSTSSVLYVLASLITPLAITVGFLAFDVKAALPILVCCGLSLGITGFIGYKLFDSKFQVSVSYIGFVWSEIFICMLLLGNFEGFAFGMCLAAFVTALIHKFLPNLRFFGVFAEVTAYVGIIGLWFCAYFRPYMCFFAIAGGIMYWVSLLLLTERRKWVKYISVLAPFLVLIFSVSESYITSRTIIAIVSVLTAAALFAVYKLLKHDNFVSNAVISIGISILLIVVKDDIRDVLYYTMLIFPVAAFAAILFLSRNKIEKAFYWYLIFFTLITVTEELGISGNLPIFLSLAVTVVSSTVLLLWKRFRNIHVVIASSAAAAYEFFYNLGNSANAQITVMVFSAVVLALYGTVVLINRFVRRPSVECDKFRYPTCRFSVLPLLIISNLYLLVGVFDISLPASFVTLLLIDVIFIVLTLFDTDNFFGVLPSITLTAALVYKLGKCDLDPALIGLIFIVVYVALGRFLICRKIVSKKRIDWLTFLAGIACFFPLDSGFKIALLLTLYTLTFIGRFGKKEDDFKTQFLSGIRIIGSIALGILAFGFAILDVQYTTVIDSEIRMLFIIIAAAVIHFVIRPGAASKWIWFVTICASIELEALHTVSEGNLIALTLISVCSIGIFIFSFIVKKRSWFILSIVAIVQFGILFAVKFWESKLWWIYLLVIGGILIGTASVNEYKKRRAVEAGQENKKVKLFSDWTW